MFVFIVCLSKKHKLHMVEVLGVCNVRIKFIRTLDRLSPLFPSLLLFNPPCLLQLTAVDLFWRHVTPLCCCAAQARRLSSYYPRFIPSRSLIVVGLGRRDFHPFHYGVNKHAITFV